MTIDEDNRYLYETINLRFSDQVSISSAGIHGFYIIGSSVSRVLRRGDERGMEADWTPEMRIVYLFPAI
jgi:hypothetical protein